MLERPVEGVSTLGREKVYALTTAATKCFLYKTPPDTAPSPRAIYDDHRKMGLNDSVALHLRKAHCPASGDPNNGTDPRCTECRPSPLVIGGVRRVAFYFAKPHYALKMLTRK